MHLLQLLHAVKHQWSMSSEHLNVSDAQNSPLTELNSVYFGLWGSVDKNWQLFILWFCKGVSKLLACTRTVRYLVFDFYPEQVNPRQVLVSIFVEPIPAFIVAYSELSFNLNNFMYKLKQRWHMSCVFSSFWIRFSHVRTIRISCNRAKQFVILNITMFTGR